MVNPDILILCYSKCVRRCFRNAGKQAGSKLLESLMGEFFGVLDKEVVERGKIVYKYS
ncbi:hypothetical protein [Thermocrinis sp.]|uniref:hypothetical protein n=1 Tax=Thermocrinis sp. TaxID=2024383 RepID=UPI00262F4425|nr:hypothetical protein [Thermocrinis sp.]